MNDAKKLSKIDYENLVHVFLSEGEVPCPIHRLKPHIERRKKAQNTTTTCLIGDLTIYISSLVCMYTDEPPELSVCPWWELADMHTHHASSTQRPIQRLILVLPLDNFVGLWGRLSRT